ncbi:MAG: tRNA pseudouridine(13) synthase TruD [Proteobacteria bacterium]|nr:tRNA pseudouridine(13) synthase TruD [Pseudomonadota bacterium]
MTALPEWATAYDPLGLDAEIRRQPSDFQVTENLSYTLDGAGEHEYLWVEKTGANTDWVAEQLAKFCGINPRDVGYAGMKDRHAITRQWFSVCQRGEVRWDEFVAEGVTILTRERHGRKLRRGAHTGNTFRIALRAADTQSHEQRLNERLALIAEQGAPNYFGEQRFGRAGGNIDMCRALFAGRRLSRSKRSIALSTARSLIFNSILDVRVRQGTWSTILAGELANLDGSGSVFAVNVVSDELVARCVAQDIHPTGSLWGDGSPASAGEVAALETVVAAEHADIAASLVATRMQPEIRALRMCVSDLHWSFEDDALWLEFRLARGGFATTVLREIAVARMAASYR